MVLQAWCDVSEVYWGRAEWFMEAKERFETALKKNFVSGLSGGETQTGPNSPPPGVRPTYECDGISTTISDKAESKLTQRFRAPQTLAVLRQVPTRETAS